MKLLSVPRPQTVQPAVLGYDTERTPAFRPRLTRSDVTNDVFRPAHSTEPSAPALYIVRSKVSLRLLSVRKEQMRSIGQKLGE